MCPMCHTTLYRTQYHPIGHARQAPDRTDPIREAIARCTGWRDRRRPAKPGLISSRSAHHCEQSVRPGRGGDAEAAPGRTGVMRSSSGVPCRALFDRGPRQGKQGALHHTRVTPNPSNTRSTDRPSHAVSSSSGIRVRPLFQFDSARYRNFFCHLTQRCASRNSYARKAE